MNCNSCGWCHWTHEEWSEERHGRQHITATSSQLTASRKSHKKLWFALAAAVIVSITLRSRISQNPWASASVRMDGYGNIHVGMAVPEAAEAADQHLVETNVYDRHCFFVAPEHGPKGLAFMVIDGRVARTDVDAPGIRTVHGAQVGDTEQRVIGLCGSSLMIQPHKYVDNGHYLTIQNGPQYGMVYETDGTHVTSIRAGRLPEAMYVEGCL